MTESMVPVGQLISLSPTADEKSSVITPKVNYIKPTDNPTGSKRKKRKISDGISYNEKKRRKSSMEYLLSQDIKLIEDEEFDFDIVLSPSSNKENNPTKSCENQNKEDTNEMGNGGSQGDGDYKDEDDDDEVFFGPVGFTEKCVSKAVAEIDPIKDDELDLSTDEFIQLMKDAQTVAYYITKESKEKEEARNEQTETDVILAQLKHDKSLASRKNSLSPLAVPLIKTPPESQNKTEGNTRLCKPLTRSASKNIPEPKSILKRNMSYSSNSGSVLSQPKGLTEAEHGHSKSTLSLSVFNPNTELQQSSTNLQNGSKSTLRRRSTFKKDSASTPVQTGIKQLKRKSLTNESSGMKERATSDTTRTPIKTGTPSLKRRSTFKRDSLTNPSSVAKERSNSDSTHTPVKPGTPSLRRRSTFKRDSLTNPTSVAKERSNSDSTHTPVKPGTPSLKRTSTFKRDSLTNPNSVAKERSHSDSAHTPVKPGTPSLKRRSTFKVNSIASPEKNSSTPVYQFQRSRSLRGRSSSGSSDYSSQLSLPKRTSALKSVSSASKLAVPKASVVSQERLSTYNQDTSSGISASKNSSGLKRVGSFSKLPTSKLAVPKQLSKLNTSLNTGASTQDNSSKSQPSQSSAAPKIKTAMMKLNLQKKTGILKTATSVKSAVAAVRSITKSSSLETAMTEEQNVQRKYLPNQSLPITPCRKKSDSSNASNTPGSSRRSFLPTPNANTDSSSKLSKNLLPASPSLSKARRPLIQNTPEIRKSQRLSIWSPVRKKQHIDPNDQYIVCTKRTTNM